MKPHKQSNTCKNNTNLMMEGKIMKINCFDIMLAMKVVRC